VGHVTLDIRPLCRPSVLTISQAPRQKPRRRRHVRHRSTQRRRHQLA
jgi:hypothetical protein